MAIFSLEPNNLLCLSHTLLLVTILSGFFLGHQSLPVLRLCALGLRIGYKNQACTVIVTSSWQWVKWWTHDPTEVMRCSERCAATPGEGYCAHGFEGVRI